MENLVIAKKTMSCVVEQEPPRTAFWSRSRQAGTAPAPIMTDMFIKKITFGTKFSVIDSYKLN